MSFIDKMMAVVIGLFVAMLCFMFVAVISDAQVNKAECGRYLSCKQIQIVE